MSTLRSSLARSLGARIARALGRGAPPGAEASEGPIRFNLESLQEQLFVTTGKVPVSGWACAESGVVAVEVYLDERLRSRADLGMDRPDVVAAHPTLPGADRSGFEATLDLSSESAGDHRLALLIRDGAGNDARVERTVRLLTELPVAGADNGAGGAVPSTIRYHLDSLGSEPLVTTGVVPISGWAVSEAGVEAVEFHLDGRLLRRVEPGLSRPDVAARFPLLPGAATSGFAEWLNLRDAPRGEHRLTVHVRDRSGARLRVERTLRLVENELLYHRHYLESQPTAAEEQELLATLAHEVQQITFELWLEADAADSAGTAATLASVAAQGYPDWRLRLLARGGAAPDLPPGEERISLASPEELGAEGAAAPGVFLAFLRPGELLAPAALTRAAQRLLESEETTLLYSDHDHVKPEGTHCSPAFKPQWSPYHLLSRDYVGGVFFLRQGEATAALCRELLADGQPAWRYELLLRLGELGGEIGHMPELLWSAPLARPGEHAGELEAVQAALERRRWPAEAVADEAPGVRRLRWRLAATPRVSVIIPTTGRLDLVRTCVESLRARTRYPDYELIFLDNGRGKHPEGIAWLREAGVRVLERHEPFNWAKLNNDGARATEGELLLFLNDDIEAVEPEWLEELVALALREDVGCVGAMLVYPDDHIQHAGVFLVDHGGGARHLLQGEPRVGRHYGALHRVVREVSCNTGACLMVRRDLFDRLGGFDERFETVGNDIDFCLRALQAGYRNLWTPHCRLVHHESVSRRQIDVSADAGRMWERWGKLFRAGDPFYNPNLTHEHPDCSPDYRRMTRRRARTEAGRAAAARQAGAAPPTGLNLIGFIHAESGVGEAARSMAAACEAAGVPFDIFPCTRHNPARMQDERWSHRCTDTPAHPVNLLQINADMIARVWSDLPDALAEGRYTIGHWVWELPEFPDEWMDAFRFVDEVWTPSSFVQAAVAHRSPVPVVRIPYVVERPEAPLAGRVALGLPEEAFLLLMMYDVNSIQERKNPRGAITAFRRAFAADDAGVGLVIKVNNSDAAESARLREMIGDAANVHLVESTLTRGEVDSLIHACDAFVSLHRAEGFGLGIAEAMALGTPVIATHWSGNTDFMHPGNAGCVDYRLVELDRDHGPYRQGQRWAEPDLDDAAAWMRRLRENAALRERLAARARVDVAEQLSARRVGELVAARLRHLRAR